MSSPGRTSQDEKSSASQKLFAQGKGKVWQAEEILAIIDQMPTGYRTVFNLFAVEGYGHKEIGEMLGISENTSKTQFLKSKEWLKKTLAEQEKYFG